MVSYTLILQTNSSYVIYLKDVCHFRFPPQRDPLDLFTSIIGHTHNMT